MSYLELAQKALESCPSMKATDAPNAESGCEKSEKSEKSPLAENWVNDDAFICRVIERDLGLPTGSLRLWEPRRPGA
jgi:hypothetical protein